GLCRRLIARTIWAAFIPSLVMGAASIVGLYALARGLAAGRGVSLLAAALLSASPTHWICSSRIWLDATLTALIVWAAAALVRGDRPRWMWLSGVFWGLAFLVKYTAFAAWAGAIVAALLAKPEWRRSRKFWAAQALAFLIFAPWVLLRFAYDGWALFAIRNSNVEDWRSLSSLLGDVRIWVGAAVGCAALFAITRPGSLRILREVRPEWIAALALLIAVTLAAIFPDRLTEMPWSGWGSNEIANSPRWFYLARPLLFEPVVLWGCLGMLWAGWDREWHLARGAWLGLFIFLTAWGNFQMRYGMPLLPFEHLFAAALLGAAFSTSGKPFRFTAVLIVAVSLLRSAWVISGMAIDNKFFYF
ncbi:MAG: glycosyltransferase family 39 protein, partial [Verrucomicrobiae bacterium]|nr:glycosyltransferase family 39 protein [Verrucomicrobiae bacterium]